VVILVLGGTGRLGRETVKLLAANGTQKVRVLLRDRAKAAAFTGSEVDITAAAVEIITGELTDAASLAEALSNVERVFVIPPNVRDQAEMESRIYRASRRAGVSYIVKLSTTKADPNSPCYFFQQHALAEAHLKESGIAFTILRSNSFMQNLLWFAPEIKTKGSFSLPMSVAKTAPVDIRDVAAVAATILNGDAHQGATYDLTGPEKLSFGEIAQRLSAATGKQIQYRDVDPSEFLEMLLRAEIPRWYAEAVTASWSVARDDEPIVTDHVAALTKKPPLTFAQFARDYAHSFSADHR
jgi:uncharacterized protein YbjT (DUF2867 family)